jgi:lipocalin
MKAAALTLVAAAAVASLSAANRCPTPQPAPGFTGPGYGGVWYEIAKAQTWGGAIFQAGCQCTTLTVSPSNDGSPTDLSIVNSCRKDAPNGPYENATGTLVNEHADAPGWFEEEFIPGLPTVNYTVIHLDADTAVEFDCADGGPILGLNYCIHLMAKRPTLDPATLASLIHFANDTLKLNVYNLPYNMTPQAGCW